MYNQKKLFVFRAITPLHVGSGSELGIIDLPIQREKHTDFPKVEASSLKGSLREAFEKKLGYDNLDVHLVFGYDEDSDRKGEVKNQLNQSNPDGRNTEFAGAVAFSDARILLFPVKSAKNIFAYVTCPNVLEKFNKERILLGYPSLELNLLENIKKYPDFCIAGSNSLLVNKKVHLDEYSFTAEINEQFAKELAEVINIPEVSDHLVIVSNEIFKNFTLFSTEVITRTKINNETGTVEEGALFNEEYLPAETIMYSMVFASSIFNEIKNNFTDDKSVLDFITENFPPYFQLGGNATLGKGIVESKLL
ncbi:type III-B CRISPR module RAMP protein Cmr4 [Melioribacter sp. OK-6-Me]|uniref:type III-B CRISPR module RAMP protein Cmr4 n=1 Tax=unclassified Melioribacter TaxID=2627329 RepID=UPI003EDB5010